MGQTITGRILINRELGLEAQSPVLMIGLNDVARVASINAHLEQELAVYRGLVAHFVQQAEGGRLEISARDLAPAWAGPDPLVERTETGYALSMPAGFDIAAHRESLGEHYRRADSGIVLAAPEDLPPHPRNGRLHP